MKKGVLTYTSEVFDTFKGCWVHMHKLSLITILPAEALVVIFHGFMTGPTADVTYGGVFIMTAVITFFLYYIAVLFIAALFTLLGRKGKACDYRLILRTSHSRFATLLLALASYHALIIAGFIAFLLPGIYFIVAFMYVPIVSVIEEKNVRDAFQRSYDLVRGRWWKTFGRLLPALLAWGILIGSMFAMPNIRFVSGFIEMVLVTTLFCASMIYVYRMYLDAKKS